MRYSRPLTIEGGRVRQGVAEASWSRRTPKEKRPWPAETMVVRVKCVCFLLTSSPETRAMARHRRKINRCYSEEVMDLALETRIMDPAH